MSRVDLTKPLPGAFVLPLTLERRKSANRRAALYLHVTSRYGYLPVRRSSST